MLTRNLEPARHCSFVELVISPAPTVADPPRVLNGGEQFSCFQRCRAELRVCVFPDSLYKARVWRGKRVEGDEDAAKDRGRDVLQCVDRVCDARLLD